MIQIHLDFITGVAVGIEYVAANPEAGVIHPALLIDLFIARLCIEFTGSED
jgi:hypothetical protein